MGVNFPPRRALLGVRPFTPLSIAGLVHWSEAQNNANTLSTAGVAGTGTTVAQSGNTLTGVGTKFLSECRVGDNISGANGLNGNITAIASDTSLTLDSSATVGAETPYTITPIAGLSDRVTTLADLSGRGNTLTQATFAKKPSLTSAAAGINGKRSFLLDGVSDLWVGANFLNGASGAIVSVYQLTASIPNTDQVLLASGDEASSTYYVGAEAYENNASPNVDVFQKNFDTDDLLKGSTTIIAGTRYIVIHASNGTAYTILVNNVAEALTVQSGANTGDWFGDTILRDNVTIGALKFNSTELYSVRGMLAATLVFDNVVLSSSNATDIFNFCGARY